MGGFYKYYTIKTTTKPKKDTKKELTKKQIAAKRNTTYNKLHKECETIENEVKMKETRHVIQQTLVQKLDSDNKSETVGGRMDGSGGGSTSNNIHQAAMEGSLCIIRWMLDKGFQADALDQNGYTPLIYACQNNQLETAFLLVTCGSNVNHQSIHGFTPLMFASWQGHTEIIALLIQHKADVKAKTFTNNDTALHFTALAGYPKACLLLRKAGARTNAKNKNKKTPMDNIKTHADQMQASMTGRKLKEIQFEQSKRFNTISKVQEEYMKFMMA